MAEYLPPSGPPPPQVPEGWKAMYNEQYSEWFYVNIYNKKSQWDKPTAPVYPPSSDGAPAGPPPGYSGGDASQSHFSDSKHNPYASSSGANPAPNPYDSKPHSNPYDSNQGSTIESDAAFAARLQAEEDERARSHGGASHATSGQPVGNRNAMNDYMNTPMPQSGSAGAGAYASQELPPQEKKGGGILGKILGAASKHSSSKPQQHGYGPQQGGYSGYAPQGYAPQGYGPPMGMGGGGGGYMQQRPQRAGGGGMGMAGGAALGLGGGLLGGMMLENALDDNGGGDDGGDYGGDDGGGGDDYGGGDDGGGGDFGGD